MGNSLQAERHLSEALSAHEPWIEAHRKVLEETRVGIRSHLASVEISGASAGTTVTVGSGSSQTLPVDGTVWLAPGSSSLRIEAPGRNSVTRVVDTKAGDRMTIDLAAAAAIPPAAPATGTAWREPNKTAPVAAERPTPEPSTSTDDGHSLRVAGITTAAVGIGIAVTGVILYQIAGAKVDRINGGKGSPSDLDYRTYDHAGIGLMIGGGVAVAAGATMYLLGRPDAGTSVVGLSFGPAPGGGVALMGGTF
ncbi:MAG TPA: hypothetical protein VGK52_19555 [Polyangia bacterium]